MNGVYFKELPDPRQAGKVIYPLAEVLLLCLLAVLAGAESFVDIARFGEKKIEFLRRFRPFHHGTPAHDHLGDIFAVLDAERFQRCFVDWVAALTGAPKEVVAIDGKTLRRSGEKKSAKAAIHMVSAFAARQRLVLGQVKVADKANEIVAIPKLLDLLAIEGAIVTLDAIGCQRAIAQQILDKKADYVLALKGNQGTLREDVELFAAEQKANGFKDAKISRHQTVDGDHGRIEKNLPCLSGCHPQPLAVVFGHAHGRSPAWQSSGSHNRCQSSSDFSLTMRPVPATWRRLAGATGSFAPIVRRRESRSASQIVLASCAAASAAVTPD